MNTNREGINNMRDIIHADEVMDSITTHAQAHVTATGTTEGLPVVGTYAREFFEEGGNEGLDLDTFDKGLAVAQLLIQETITALYASAVATELEMQREGDVTGEEEGFVMGVKIAAHTFTDLFSGGLAHTLESVAPAAPSYDEFIQQLIDGRFDELVAAL